MISKFPLGPIRVITLLVFSIFTFSGVSAEPFRAKKGLLDLRKIDFAAGAIVTLDGEWEFYWNKLYRDDKDFIKNKSQVQYLKVPDVWNNAKMPGSSGKDYPARGFATYRLTVLLAPDAGNLALRMPDTATAFRLYVNGKAAMGNGKVGRTAKDYHPQYLPGALSLDKPGEKLEIIVEVANFKHSKAGVWDSLSIGAAPRIFARREVAIWTDIFLAGAFLIMGLYHFGLFALRRKEYSSLLFGAVCIALLVRLLLTGERVLIQIFPNMPFELFQKGEYISVFLTAPLFVRFFKILFPREVHRAFVVGVDVIFGGLIALALVTPLAVYSQALPVFFLSVIACFILGAVMLMLAVLRRREGALAAYVGYLVFAASGINDILYSEDIINTVLLLPVGLFAFIFSQSFLLSMRFSTAFTKVENLTVSLKHSANELMTTNQAYSRFVPREFLSLLNKESITDIDLGDQIQRDMTVLFADIRSFTSLSEDMSPGENFEFLNAYLQRMEPPVQRHNGFIDKFIGDAIMALFPGNPEDAVEAAVEMQRELREYNRMRSQSGLDLITTGVGLHTGSMMLGTIGSSTRMEGTVISDTVNLASRLEGVTKKFGSQIIVSEAVLSAARDRERYITRGLGKVRVKGKSHVVSIFEIWNGLPEERIELMFRTRENFEDGIAFLEQGRPGDARRNFQEVLRVDPRDQAAGVFLERSAESA